MSGSRQSHRNVVEAFKQGMREQGYADVALVYDVAYAEGRTERFPVQVQEIIARKPDVIVVAGPLMTRLVLDATRSIPVVMANVSNPVGNKFVASLARPGGNVTGIATLYEKLLPKIAEILHELAPRAQRVAVLVSETSPSHAIFWEHADKGLRSLGKAPMRFVANKPEEFDSVFAAMAKSRVQGMIVVAEPTYMANREKLAALALKTKIPAGFGISEHAEAGGLFAYGPSFPGNFRAAARFVDKVLKGAKPGEVPTEQPTQFELVVNLKTAKALGIAIPQSVRIRTNRVIE